MANGNANGFTKADSAVEEINKYIIAQYITT